MFNFITKRPLWVNVIAGIILAFLLVFIFLKMLGWITQHGKYLTVPAVTGMKTDDAIKLLEKQGFDVQIQDSIFTDTAATGIVLKQLPDPNATVKINRTVLLTVNKVIPPMVELPQLEGQSLYFALDLLRRNHLQLGDTIFKHTFAKGTIIEAQYNGATIKAKTPVQWGSKITLVVSSGTGDEQMPVPDLMNMTVRDVKALLESKEILLGSILPDPDVRDTANAFVYYQDPPQFDEEKKPKFIKPGQIMDIRVSVAKKAIKDSITVNNPN
ncbi:MAG: PASTA domain-containing protein [Bacteroidetes bacterium]|nr:PASTA domain-containing protein [Bacteroidota bacterium]